MYETVAEIVLSRRDSTSQAICFEESTWTYREYFDACVKRAALASKLRNGPKFHIGLLLDNVPEYPMWLGAAALSGATVVGINPTRRGAELERDINHTECDIVITENCYLELLKPLNISTSEIYNIDDPKYSLLIDTYSAYDSESLSVIPSKESLYLLVFTSGTSAAPKAVICSQGRLAFIGSVVAQMFDITSDDVNYCAMPLFHSNALMACWCPTMAAGATLCLRRKFSASSFIDDVRKYGVTYFNYVGKTLSYILATQERPDDANNPLKRGFGNEGTQIDVETFSTRFDCKITDAYGSTEGGAVVSASPDTPKGALGPLPNGTVVLDPTTGEECPRAIIDKNGKLLNPDEAIGEMVNKFGAASFEGYWNNDEATSERLKDGLYWTGDLAYVDEAGFIYFAGRSYDWIRVDGENFASSPIERIISRFPPVAIVAIYAVPDPLVGDQVMAALELKDNCNFSSADFSEFLSSQSDLGTKWAPKFVRISKELPRTQSNKVIKNQLRREFWECNDPVFYRKGKDLIYQSMTEQDRQELRSIFVAKDRAEFLENL